MRGNQDQRPANLLREDFDFPRLFPLLIVSLYQGIPTSGVVEMILGLWGCQDCRSAPEDGVFMSLIR